MIETIPQETANNQPEGISLERKQELQEPPNEGTSALLSIQEIFEIRHIINSDPELLQCYEKARRALSGGSEIKISRGWIINQMLMKISAESPELQEKLKKIIREQIAHNTK